MRHAPFPPATLRSRLLSLHRDESGQALTEHIIILAAISLVALGVLDLFCGALSRLAGRAVDGLDVLTSNLD